MRHHHSGLALAWVLAAAGAGLACEALAARRRERIARAALALPLLLIAAFPHWARRTWEATLSLYRGHARAAEWLATHAHRQVVLLTDAGWLAVVHDGPAIDALGLGSPDLTEAWANGSGALLESLARRRPLPEIAVVDPKFALPLLTERLLPGRAMGEYTVVAGVFRGVLARAARGGPGGRFPPPPGGRPPPPPLAPPPPPGGGPPPPPPPP